jgi:hypothetical protein
MFPCYQYSLQYIYKFMYLFTYLVLRIRSSDTRISTGLPVGSLCSFSQCLQTNVVVFKRATAQLSYTLQFVVFPWCIKHHNNDYKYNAEYLLPDTVCEFLSSRSDVVEIIVLLGCDITSHPRRTTTSTDSIRQLTCFAHDAPRVTQKTVLRAFQMWTLGTK